MEARVAALLDAYRAAGQALDGLPVFNSALAVEAVGFRHHLPGWIGCVISPWFLNAVILPHERSHWSDRLDGDRLEIALPSGAYQATAARLDGVGVVASIPVVSAMNVFANQDEARDGAILALDQLMRPPASVDGEAKPALSRRSLFGGRGA